MIRAASLVALATLAVAPVLSLAVPAQAQIGTIFSNPPPRPPGNVPAPPSDDEEEVPDLPNQGRVLPIPSRPLPQPGIAAPPPGAVQSQPLPPPPGAAAAPPGQPGLAAAPPPAAPGVPPASQPPGAKQQAKGAPSAPPAPASLQPGDEIVTEPPAQKVINKKAVFSGLDKITGRIINFDVDIGETVQFGALRVKPDACYTRPATEATNTDAFVEVEEITLQGEVKKIFSGWMFAASPGLHGVEHPIYDIWLTDCKGPDQTVATQVDTPPPAPAQPPKPAPAKRQQSARQNPSSQVTAPSPQQPPPPQRQPGLLPPFQQ